VSGLAGVNAPDVTSGVLIAAGTDAALIEQRHEPFASLGQRVTAASEEATLTVVLPFHGSRAATSRMLSFIRSIVCRMPCRASSIFSSRSAIARMRSSTVISFFFQCSSCSVTVGKPCSLQSASTSERDFVVAIVVFLLIVLFFRLALRLQAEVYGVAQDVHLLSFVRFLLNEVVPVFAIGSFPQDNVRVGSLLALEKAVLLKKRHVN